MRILLTLIAAMLCASAHAAFFPNSFTTNANGKFELLLAAPSPSSNWFVVIHVDGNGTIFESPKFYGINTNLSWNGLFSAANGAFTNGLTLNGVPVLTNAPTAVNNLIATQYVRMPWNTLTMTGSNVSTIDFSSGSMFKLLATNNAFLGTPSNMPGTNLAQIIQFAFIEDGTGGRTLTTTNGSWQLNGSGFSTNQLVAVNTNANSVTIITFVTSPTNAAIAYGVVAAIGQ